MGQIVYEEFNDFHNGVITSLREDEIPPSASPRGWNSAMSFQAGEKAAISTRRGLRTVNNTPITGSPEVLNQFLYRRRNAGALVNHYLTYTSNGRLDSIDIAAGSVTSLATGLDGARPPDFATMNNLAFLVNGVTQRKYNGTVVQNFGIVAPSAPTIADGGAGVMSAGTFEIAITAYNSATGEESSRSPLSSITQAINKQINVTIPSHSDSQVDFIRVYIRKTTLTGNLFKVSSGTGYNSTGGGWAVGFGTAVVNLTDNSLLALTIVSPDEDENDPPPADLKYIEVHAGRMFGANDHTLFYSKIGHPEQWDPDFAEPVNKDDGQLITGLQDAGEFIIIFKTNSVWGLFGDDPNSWDLKRLDADCGCISFRSIVQVEKLTYWWSERGPVVWDYQGIPRPIGLELLAADVAPSNINFTQLSRIVGVADYTRQRVLWAVPGASESRNTFILPYNYRLQRWDSNKWDPIDTASFGVNYHATTGDPYVIHGGYAGQLFELWTTDTDGVPSGTTSGNFVPGATPITTITDGGATFHTSGGALIERKVTILDANGAYVARRRITSNTATVLTFTPSVVVNVGATYTYIVGGPDFQWDLYWSDFDLPFTKKRFEFLFIHALAAANTNLNIDMGFNNDTAYGQSFQFSLAAESALWNSPMWTHDEYGTQEVKSFRKRVGRTGISYRLTARNHFPEKPVTLLKFAVRAEKQTQKLG